MRGAAGFTLLEILVALAVLGFIMLGLTQATRFGLAAWDRQGHGLAARGDLDAVDRALRRLIEQAEPGDQTNPPHFAGGPGGLAFATELPLAAGALPTRRADVELGVDAAHRLVLRWTPNLHATQAMAPLPQEAELLRGIARIEFGYLRPASSGGGWSTSWDGPILPRLVRIRILFADRRRWPDIVAAPLREQP